LPARLLPAEILFRPMALGVREMRGITHGLAQGGARAACLRWRMSIHEFVECLFPAPGGDNTIDYLCHHLSPTQMARVIHALRLNESEAGREEDGATYRELQQRIYHHLAGSCGAENAGKFLAVTQNENYE
jgi:hypothetical protein